MSSAEYRLEHKCEESTQDRGKKHSKRLERKKYSRSSQRATNSS